MIIKIPLTQEKEALIDDEDWDIVKNYKGYAHKEHSCKSRDVFYAHTKKNKKTILMHRLLLNAPKRLMVDHINGDGLDNRRSNIRLVSNRQNQQNRHSKTSSNYPGVYWDGKRWRSIIRINGIKKILGSFKDEKSAFEAYKSAVFELTGEKVIMYGT